MSITNSSRIYSHVITVCTIIILNCCVVFFECMFTNLFNQISFNMYLKDNYCNHSKVILQSIVSVLKKTFYASKTMIL